MKTKSSKTTMPKYNFADICETPEELETVMKVLASGRLTFAVVKAYLRANGREMVLRDQAKSRRLLLSFGMKPQSIKKHEAAERKAQAEARRFFFLSVKKFGPDWMRKLWLGKDRKGRFDNERV